MTLKGHHEAIFYDDFMAIANHAFPCYWVGVLLRWWLVWYLSECQISYVCLLDWYCRSNLWDGRTYLSGAPCPSFKYFFLNFVIYSVIKCKIRHNEFYYSYQKWMFHMFDDWSLNKFYEQHKQSIFTSFSPFLLILLYTSQIA